MNKKLLITLLASVCAVGCAAGLAACNSGNGGDGASIFKYSNTETAATVGEQTITVSYTPNYNNYEEIQIEITVKVTATPAGGQP